MAPPFLDLRFRPVSFISSERDSSIHQTGVWVGPEVNTDAVVKKYLAPAGRKTWTDQSETSHYNDRVSKIIVNDLFVVCYDSLLNLYSEFSVYYLRGDGFMHCICQATKEQRT
jgi:hypothetical protein